MNNTSKYIAVIIEFKSVLDVVMLLITIFMLILLFYLAHRIIIKHK